MDPTGREDFSKTFVNLGMPMVVVGASYGNQRISYIDMDNYQGAVLATEHLIALGHRRIGFCGGIVEHVDAIERERAFRKTMRRHGLPVIEKWVLHCDFEMRKALHAGLKLLDTRDRPTGIFSANDVMAFGLIDAARILGLAVPSDLSVAGFDDIDDAAAFLPPLTTVGQPIQEIGRTAVAYLLGAIGNPRPPILHQRLPAQLFIRASTAAPPKTGGS